jgi:hypothetical protein
VIKPILEGHADVVYGSRFLVRKATRVLYFYHFLANKVLTFSSNMLTNLNMTDVETGYKAFRGEIIRNMIIKSSGFGFEIEVTAKIAKLGCAVYEVPISYYGRTYEEGKKIGVRDGLQAFWLVFRFNLFCGLPASFRQIPQIERLRPSPVLTPQAGQRGWREGQSETHHLQRLGRVTPVVIADDIRTTTRLKLRAFLKKGASLLG